MKLNVQVPGSFMRAPYRPCFLLALYIPDQRCVSLVSLSARCVPYRCSDLGEGDERYNKTLIDRVCYTSDASALC